MGCIFGISARSIFKNNHHSRITYPNEDIARLVKIRHNNSDNNAEIYLLHNKDKRVINR